jgi:hypothetical protein
LAANARDGVTSTGPPQLPGRIQHRGFPRKRPSGSSGSIITVCSRTSGRSIIRCSC